MFGQGERCGWQTPRGIGAKVSVPERTDTDFSLQQKFDLFNKIGETVNLFDFEKLITC